MTITFSMKALPIDRTTEEKYRRNGNSMEENEGNKLEYLVFEPATYMI
jgi:hypothetical protein